MTLRVPHPALVIGADCITGLQTTRILAARGVPVLGLAADPAHFCCRTRAAQAVIATETSGDGLLETLERLAPRWPRPPVLIPCTDDSVATLVRHTPRGYRTALPPAETVDRLAPKDGFATHAAAHGLPIPPTIVVRDRDDARVVAELRFPCVVKPSMKTPAWEEAVGGKVVVVDSYHGWEDLYRRTADLVDGMVVQEWVPGGDDRMVTSNWYTARDGTTITFVSRKIRQWPVHSGTGSLAGSVLDEEMLDLTAALLATVEYRGLGYLEIKRDQVTGRSLIIEPNVGRPTGRSALAEACGTELLMTMYADALDLPLPPVGPQREGVKWMYVRHDLQSAAAAMAAGELTVRAWWRSVSGPRVYAVFSWRDPVPFVADWGRSVRRLARELRPRRRRAPSPRPLRGSVLR